MIEYKECPLCLGSGKVSPAYYSKNTGVTRWTENIVTGHVLDINNKSYSLFNCPVCHKSDEKGQLKSIDKCTETPKCEQKSTKQAKLDKNIFLAWMKRYNIPQKLITETKSFDDFEFSKIVYEAKHSWIFDTSKRIRLLLAQRITGDWMTEEATYNNKKYAKTPLGVEKR